MSRQMKDSGIEWIGEIPETWELIRLCNVTDDIFLGRTPVYVEEENQNYIVGQKNNQNYGIDFSGIKYGDEEFYLSRPDKEFLKVGDILLNTLGGGSVGRIGYWDVEDDNKYLTDGHLMVIRPCEHCWRRFLYYAMYSQQKKLEDDAVGSTNQAFLTVTQVYKNLIAYTGLNEQKKIADFLDQQCAHIDAVIEKTKASIEEYKKLKQAVITQAVTKGIRGDRPMKDSGIEWIGEIPANWNIVKGHRIICSTQNGLTRRDLEKSEGHIVLKLKNMNESGYIDYSEINKIELTEREIETYRLVDGDFLFVRVNGSKKLVGKCAIYKDSGEIVAYNDHIIRVRLNDICCKDFFYWFLYSQVGKTEIELHTSTAAGQFTISGEGLRDIYVVLPNAIEQKEISKYLIEKSLSIDELIIKKEQIIEELESYKKSLIYEYVTGKKEVPQSCQ